MSKPIKNTTEIVAQIEKVKDLFNEDLKKQQWVVWAGNMAKSAGIIGNLAVIGISLWGSQTDPVKEMTKQLMDKMDSISLQIDNAVLELKVFIAKSQFCSRVQEPVTNLLHDVTQFIKNPNEKSKENLVAMKREPTRILNAIFTMLSCDNCIEPQLKKDCYTDAAFEGVQNLYIGLVKKMVFAYGVIEMAVYREVDCQEIKDLAEKIQKNLDAANSARGDKYWTNSDMESLMKNFMGVHGSYAAAARGIYNEMVRKYGKTGYTFAVGVYDGCTGSNDYLYKGDIKCVVRHNGRNAFIMRNYNTSLNHRSNFIHEFCRTWKQNQTMTNVYVAVRGKSIDPLKLELLCDEIWKEDKAPAAVAVIRNKHRLAFDISSGFETFSHNQLVTILVANKPAGIRQF